MKESNGKTKETRGYAPINGLKMYYEIEGTGDPVVCIPPAFGYAGVNPYSALVQSHTVITVDLQGHGRTADIPERPLSIEQYAKKDFRTKSWLQSKRRFSSFSEITILSALSTPLRPSSSSPTPSSP